MSSKKFWKFSKFRPTKQLNDNQSVDQTLKSSLVQQNISSIEKKSVVKSDTTSQIITNRENKSGQVLRQKPKTLFGRIKSTLRRLLCCCGRSETSTDTETNGAQSLNTLSEVMAENESKPKEYMAQQIPEDTRIRAQTCLQSTIEKEWKPKGYIAQQIPEDTRIRAQKCLKRLESDHMILGQYISRGGYGFVVEALDENEKKLAVKIVDLTKTESFDEIELMQQLKHQNIIGLRTGFVENHIKIVVMPYAITDLFSYICQVAVFKKELLSEKEVRHIFHQMLSGIEHMHSKGYAHRDLKPDNVLITDLNHMHIKISDFDLVKKVFDQNGKLIHSFEICGKS
jgi:RIO-like serine/threonine protein kinase